MPRRPLTDVEQAYFAPVFRQGIRFGDVTITRGHIAATFSATTLGNTVHLQPRHFDADGMVLNDAGKATLMHELGHVWQYQHGGIGYVARSLFAQLKAWMTKGSRDAAYDWLAAMNANRPWERWNPEQQAECIACYGRSWLRKQGGKSETKGNPEGRTDDEILSYTAKYMDKVWEPRSLR